MGVKVLILIVVEDSLVPLVMALKPTPHGSLNPYCSGR